MRRTITGKRNLTGRGALSNPAGRFDLRQLAPVDDGWYVEESPDSVATTLEPETARSIISHNDSPDVPFESSINPYRGCESGCVYCVSGDTPVLMADGGRREISHLKVGDEIYGTERRGWHRHYVKTRVLAHWSVIKPAHRVKLEDGTELVAGADHRWLTQRGWKYTTDAQQGPRRAHLRHGDKLMGVGAFARAEEKNDEYRRGYLCGMCRGDGAPARLHLANPHGGVAHRGAFPLPVCATQGLDRSQSNPQGWYSQTRPLLFSLATGRGRAMPAFQGTSHAPVAHTPELITWPETPSRSWHIGFLAGIFDAKGSYSRGILRIGDSANTVITRICSALRALDFKFSVEHRPFAHRRPMVVRLLGGLREHLRFFHSVDPAIRGKLDISGQGVTSGAKLGVVSIEPVGRAMRLYDITTGSEDFIANGVVSHNCYARPSHAYVGLSPGLDFETRLFYKADAAKLLEAELAKPGYVCKPITVGANTDPYQPVERRMRITRSILEVFARTRHPVTIITKHALVLRDIDLLADLARDGLASVAVSVTSLDAELKRALEPRAASPLARLRAVKELNAAGIPSGVLVAPVIPALTDHELEAILEAAAEAGAPWAGYVLLRLPYEIKDLFHEWLTEHYPQRAAHVMSVIRSMRGGRENDPRFGTRMRGTGPFAQLLRNRFRIACRRLNLNASTRGPLSTALFRPPTPPGSQLGLGF